MRDSKRTTPHDIRRTFATSILAVGAPLPVVQQLMWSDGPCERPDHGAVRPLEQGHQAPRGGQSDPYPVPIRSMVVAR